MSLKTLITIGLVAVLLLGFGLVAAQMAGGAEKGEAGLQQVIENQEKMIAMLEEIKAELQVIKVRASR